MESCSEAPTDAESTGRSRPSGRGVAAKRRRADAGEQTTCPEPTSKKGTAIKKKWAEDRAAAEKAGVSVMSYRAERSASKPRSTPRKSKDPSSTARHARDGEVPRGRKPDLMLDAALADILGTVSEKRPSGEAQTAEAGETDKEVRRTPGPTRQHSAREDNDAVGQQIVNGVKELEEHIAQSMERLQSALSDQLVELIAKQLGSLRADLCAEVQALHEQAETVLAGMATQRSIGHASSQGSSVPSHDQAMKAPATPPPETGLADMREPNDARGETRKIVQDGAAHAPASSGDVDRSEAPLIGPDSSQQAFHISTGGKAPASGHGTLSEAPLTGANSGLQASHVSTGGMGPAAGQLKSDAAGSNSRLSKRRNLLPVANSSATLEKCQRLGAKVASNTGSGAESDSEWSAEVAGKLLREAMPPQGLSSEIDIGKDTDDDDGNSSEVASALLCEMSSVKQRNHAVREEGIQNAHDSTKPSFLAAPSHMAHARLGSIAVNSRESENQSACEDHEIEQADDNSAAADELLAAGRDDDMASQGGDSSDAACDLLAHANENDAISGQVGREGEVEESEGESSCVADDLLADLSSTRQLRANSKSPRLAPASVPLHVQRDPSVSKACPGLAPTSLPLPIRAPASMPLDLQRAPTAVGNLALGREPGVNTRSTDRREWDGGYVPWTEAAELGLGAGADRASKDALIRAPEEERWQHVQQQLEFSASLRLDSTETSSNQYDSALASSLRQSGFTVLDPEKPNGTIMSQEHDEPKGLVKSQARKKKEWFNKMYDSSAVKNGQQQQQQQALRPRAVVVHRGVAFPPRGASRQTVADKGYAALPGTKRVATLPPSPVGVCREPPAVDEVLPPLPLGSSHQA